MRTSFLLLFLAVVCFSPGASALTVNRLNGGASLIYVDFSLTAGPVPLELLRSYNTITAANENTGWSGAFGWGWTAPFETTLTTTPDRTVLLRDGGTGNTVAFRPEKEDPKAKALFYENLKRAYFEAKDGRKLSPGELAKAKLPENVLSKLKTDPLYRTEMGDRYGIKGAPTEGILISSEYGYQTIQFKNNQWVREKDGITQNFDQEGRLIRQQDKNGAIFNFKYSPVQKNQLVEISDQNRMMALKFTWKGEKVTEIVDNRNQVAKYSYDGLGNLTEVVDSNSQSFVYKYENKKFPHLLSKIEYVTESSAKARVFREIGYDDTGLVTYHRDKDGSETLFTYGKGQSDPENNFWTKSVHKAKGVTEEQYDEYFIKARADGSKYLYKQETRANGVTSVTVFTACCGKPQQIVRNGETTNFKYYENGLLEEKVGPKEELKIEYDPRWKKASKVSQNGVTSTYEYDNRGNLTKAANSKNEKVALKYDKSGRILEMTDPEGKQISFQYNPNGRPTLISEKGVGAVKIEYDGEGRIKRTESVGSKAGRRPSEAQSQEVIRRVMRGFQNLLEILRPAGTSFTS